MGDNPSHFKGPKTPRTTSRGTIVSGFWKAQREVAHWERQVRVAHRAQWEYACRAGSSTRYCFGDDEARLGEFAWHGGNSDNKTHAVGEKEPNAWELYDMHGNVWEWCQDWYDDGYYAKSPADDPRGPETGSFRASRR